MTEADWLACQKPDRMLAFLRGKVSDRKLRLFAAACGRSQWLWLQDDRSRLAVLVAERFADGEAGQGDLMTASEDAWRAAGELGRIQPAPHGYNAAGAAAAACWHRPSFAVEASAHATLAVGGPAVCKLVREIFGNPFRSISRNPAWRTWQTGYIQEFAQEIYAERRFEDLSRLASALQQTGAPHAMLEHCRDPGPHFRGCWALDLVLSRD